MEARLCVNQTTGRVVCLEAPRAFVERIRKLQERTLGEVVEELSECYGGDTEGEAHAASPALVTLFAAIRSKDLGTIDPRDLSLPQRVQAPALHPEPIPRRSLGLRVAFTNRPTFLQRRDSCNRCQETRYNCHDQPFYIPYPGTASDLDTSRPILKCTSFYCLTYSNLPLVACPRCKKGIMGLNCDSNIHSPIFPRLPPGTTFPLGGDFVVQEPFVAFKEDVEGGLDLTWEGAPREYLEEARASTLRLGEFISWCIGCKKLQSSSEVEGKQCLVCKGSGSWCYTFVTADPSDPTRRVYWPVGSLLPTNQSMAVKQGDSTQQPLPAPGPVETHKEPALVTLPTGAVQAEPSEKQCFASSYCVITGSLELHTELSPIQLLHFLKENGIFTLEDLDVITVRVGPEQIKRILLCGLDAGNTDVLSEAFAQELGRI